MGAILTKGFIQQGQVIVPKPIDLPDGAEVVVSTPVASDDDGPMSPQEIASVLAGMGKIEPFDWTAEERAAADAWEKKVNDYTIANMDKGLEDVFP